MNFQTMDYVVALAEEQNFTKAARRLSVTQQTLSAHIARVEKSYNIQLFERTQPLKLTYAGRVLYHAAKEMLSRYRNLEHQLHDISNDERGLLRIGISPTRGHALLPRVIAAYQKCHPGVTIELAEDQDSELVTKLQEGHIDLVITSGDIANRPGLVVQTLFDEHIVLVVARKLLQALYGDHSSALVERLRTTADLSALEGCPFLLLGNKDAAGSMSRSYLQRSQIDAKVSVYSTNVETLLSLAARGVGACFCAHSLVRATMNAQEMDELEIVELGTGEFGEPSRYSIVAAWRADEEIWQPLSCFVKELQEQRA